MKSLDSEIIDLFKQSQNPNSKWYNDDVAAFIRVLKTKTTKEKQQQLANMRALAGLDPKFNAAVEKEEKRLVRAGMYDLGNMKPENALD